MQDVLHVCMCYNDVNDSSDVQFQQSRFFNLKNVGFALKLLFFSAGRKEILAGRKEISAGSNTHISTRRAVILAGQKRRSLPLSDMTRKDEFSSRRWGKVFFSCTVTVLQCYSSLILLIITLIISVSYLQHIIL